MNTKSRGPKPNTTPLNERVCKRGHVGQYRHRGGQKPACYECSKIASAKFATRVGPAHKRVPLEERICGNGHVGKYRMTSGRARCSECSRIAYEAWQARARDTTREEQALARLLKRREYLIAELAELTIRITFEESIIKQRQERV
jgi:hypothetical protein